MSKTFSRETATFNPHTLRTRVPHGIWDTPSELESAVARIGKAIKLREDYESPPYLGDTVTVDIAALEALLLDVGDVRQRKREIESLECEVASLLEDLGYLRHKLHTSEADYANLNYEYIRLLQTRKAQ